MDPSHDALQALIPPVEDAAWHSWAPNPSHAVTRWMDCWDGRGLCWNPLKLNSSRICSNEEFRSSRFLVCCVQGLPDVPLTDESSVGEEGFSSQVPTRRLPLQASQTSQLFSAVRHRLLPVLVLVLDCLGSVCRKMAPGCLISLSERWFCSARMIRVPEGPCGLTVEGF